MVSKQLEAEGAISFQEKLSLPHNWLWRVKNLPLSWSQSIRVRAQLHPDSHAVASRTPLNTASRIGPTDYMHGYFLSGSLILLSGWVISPISAAARADVCCLSGPICVCMAAQACSALQGSCTQKALLKASTQIVPNSKKRKQGSIGLQPHLIPARCSMSSLSRL